MIWCKLYPLASALVLCVMLLLPGVKGKRLVVVLAAKQIHGLKGHHISRSFIIIIVITARGPEYFNLHGHA